MIALSFFGCSKVDDGGGGVAVSDAESSASGGDSCDWIEGEFQSYVLSDALCCGFEVGDRLCKKYTRESFSDLMECQSEGNFKKVDECERRSTDTYQSDCYDDVGGDAYCGGGYG